MSYRPKFGKGNEGFLLNRQLTVGVVPVEAILPLDDLDGCTFQLLTEGADRAVVVTAADAVVAGTRTWAFANGAFTAADVGGTITVAGAVNPSNNGVFAIASVTDGTHVVVAAPNFNPTYPAYGLGGGALVNETLPVTATLIVRGGPAAILTGGWTFQASNDWSSGPGYGQLTTPGRWAPVPTGLITPAPAAVAAYSDQIIQISPIFARAVKAIFTPTANTGFISALAYGRSAA